VPKKGTKTEPNSVVFNTTDFGPLSGAKLEPNRPWNLKLAGRKVGKWLAGGKKHGTGLNCLWHMGPRTVGWDGGTRLALWMIKRVTMNDNIQNLRYSTDSCQMEANDERGRTKYNMFGIGHKEGGVTRLNCSGGGEVRREDYLGHCKWRAYQVFTNNQMTVYGCVGICNTHALLGILLTALQRRPPQLPISTPSLVSHPPKTSDTGVLG